MSEAVIRCLARGKSVGRCGSFADVVILGSDTAEQRKRGRIATHGFGNSASCSQRFSVSRASRFLGKRTRLGVSWAAPLPAPPGRPWLPPAGPGISGRPRRFPDPGHSRPAAAPGFPRPPIPGAYSNKGVAGVSRMLGCFPGYCWPPGCCRSSCRCPPPSRGFANNLN